MTRKVKTKQTIRVVRDGRVIREEFGEGAPPETRTADASRIEDLRKIASVRADSCIYCGKTKGLSREHAVPFALGGTLTIIDGSCETCRNKTRAFEAEVLSGPLRMARFVQNMPSRRKHRNVPKTVPLNVTRADGKEEQIELPIAQAPILVVFCEYGEPTFFNFGAGTDLRVVATVTGSYGKDPAQVAESLAVQDMQIVLPPTSPVVFARMIAKIAYCFAYANGYLAKIQNPDDLVRAFMDEPDTLGRFVGSLPPPFHLYAGLGLRLAVKVKQPENIAYAEVQLFAASGAPTYLVVLGRLKKGATLA